jgi:hypothetical protein
LNIERISTFAGFVPGNVNGTGVNAYFKNPAALCVNPHDLCLYICDSGNSAIRKLTMNGTEPTYVVLLFFNFLLGQVSTFVNLDKTHFPVGITMNCNENVFFAISSSSRSVIKITSAGTKFNLTP